MTKSNGGHCRMMTKKDTKFDKYDRDMLRTKSDRQTDRMIPVYPVSSFEKPDVDIVDLLSRGEILLCSFVCFCTVQSMFVKCAW